jgi:hypothetical protein
MAAGILRILSILAHGDGRAEIRLHTSVHHVVKLPQSLHRHTTVRHVATVGIYNQLSAVTCTGQK